MALRVSRQRPYVYDRPLIISESYPVHSSLIFLQMKTINLYFIWISMFLPIMLTAQIDPSIEPTPPSAISNPGELSPEEALSFGEQHSQGTHNRMNSAYRRSATLYQNYDTEWIDNDSVQYTYVAGYQREEVMQWEWDGFLWLTSDRTLYTYDADGIQTESRDQMFDGLLWINEYRRIYGYDSVLNRLNQYIFQDWDANQWENRYQFHYTFDADGYTRSYTREDWQNESWLKQYRYIYERDDDHNLEFVLRQNWNQTLNAWEDDRRSIYSYVANGNQDEILTQLWDGSMWVDSWKTAFTYTSTGLLESRIEYARTNNAWVNSTAIVYTYTTANYRESSSYQAWNGIEWQNTSRLIYVYDDDGKLMESVSQRWNLALQTFYFTSRRIYHYESFQLTSSLTSSEATLSHKAYPNPFRDQVEIHFDNPNHSSALLKIYTLAGQQVAQLEAAPSAQSLSWDGQSGQGAPLPNGLYLYHLILGKKEVTGTLSRQR